MTAAGPTNLTRCICESALFSTVVSGGAGPAHFVWKANGRLLEGETNRMLLLQNLKETNAGLYTVEVNGPCNSVTNSATLTVEGTLQNPLIIDNPASIAINDHPVTSSPYPSKINVKCVPGILTNLIVILRGFSHEFPDDVDIMLVSPAGRGVKLMSDAAGGEPVTGLSLTFNDAATSSLPDEDESLLVSGVFRATDYESNDSLPAPAPSGPYATNLTALTGIVPNGMWSLYVFDDARGDAGSIASGWSLRLSWQPTPPSVSAPMILPDGRFQMMVTSLPGLTYVIEASTDLETWVPIGTNTVSETTFNYIDAEGWNHSRRFYRVIRCP